MDPQSTETLVNQSISNNEFHTPVRSQTIGVSNNPKIPFKKIGIIILLLLIFIPLSIFLLQNKSLLTSDEQNISPKPTLSPTPVQTQNQIEDGTKIILNPGKEFYNDKLSIITKDTPHKVFIISVIRSEQETNYFQYSNIQYFDGNIWKESNVNNTVSNDSVSNNIVIRNWTSAMSDPSSRDVSFELNFGDSNWKLHSNSFQGEISLVSTPEFTKFVSQGTGKVLINDKEFDSFFTYTRSYSVDAITLNYLNDPKLTNYNWISVWDENGDFYVIDILSSNKQSLNNQSYKVGAIQDLNATVQRASSVNVAKLQNDINYVASLNNISLNLNLITNINKSDQEINLIQSNGIVDGVLQQKNSSKSDNNQQSLTGFIEYRSSTE